MLAFLKPNPYEDLSVRQLGPCDSDMLSYWMYLSRDHSLPSFQKTMELRTEQEPETFGIIGSNISSEEV